jgi:hypothetical protein
VPGSLVLSASSKRAFDRLTADASRIFGDRLDAVIAYSATNGLVFVRGLTHEDIVACGALVETWHREGLATPLFMSLDEFRRSLDAFPLEYQAILDRHLVLAGRSPFDGVTIHADDLRRACETEARGHLIHLRQGWLEAGGHSGDVADLIVRSIPAWRALLGSVMRLHGLPATDNDLSQFAARELGIPTDVSLVLFALETRPELAGQAVDHFREYVSASERLWSVVDTWRSR